MTLQRCCHCLWLFHDRLVDAMSLLIAAACFHLGCCDPWLSSWHYCNQMKTYKIRCIHDLRELPLVPGGRPGNGHTYRWVPYCGVNHCSVQCHKQRTRYKLSAGWISCNGQVSGYGLRGLLSAKTVAFYDVWTNVNVCGASRRNQQARWGHANARVAAVLSCSTILPGSIHLCRPLGGR